MKRELTTKKIAIPLRDPFIEHLLRKNILSKIQVFEAFKIQSEINKKIGEFAVEKGLMHDKDVDKILRVQSKIKKHFGKLAMQMQLISEEQLEFLLEQQQQHYVTLLEVLIHEDMISYEECSKHLLYYKTQNPHYHISIKEDKDQEQFKHSQFEDSIVGDIGAFSLVPILQIVAMYGSSGILRIYDANDKIIGKIYLRNSSVATCSFKNIDGKEAFFAILKLKKGRFEFAQQKIESGSSEGQIEFLLMEFAKEVDEER
ncbi:DUF4388 domain-containing protein [Candidatus Uabimicrobium sp. HlEnr_7]|uniref:DUF4388 domain-containing protein n=1 Tax=Candidatus Uabimicrobium helgolandensis TaxID=3095367 RepID=UPI0035577379